MSLRIAPAMIPRKRQCRASAILGLALAAATAGGETAPWRYWDDPAALALDRQDYAVVQRSSFSPEPCLYDAQGQVLDGSELARACRFDHLWESRGRARYLRREGDERIVLDEYGTGALVRIWMTTGDGYSAPFAEQIRLRLRIDDDPVPYLDLPVAELFGGNVWPFVWPLAGNRDNGAGASFSLVPIAFQHRLVASLVIPDVLANTEAQDLPIWYQFNIQRMASATKQPSGIPGDIAAALAFAATSPGNYPWPLPLDWQYGQVEFGGDDSAVVLKSENADTLLALRLRPNSEHDWSRLGLKLIFDSETRADLRLDQLFGLESSSADAPRSLLHGIDEHGYGYFYLPMPFHTGAIVRLYRLDGEASPAVEYGYALAGVPPATDALRLRASVHQTCIDGGRLEPDLQLLDLSGRGRWIAIYTRQQNIVTDQIGGVGNYLEGDERLYVDGSPHPSWHGTGNEDFYNGGFYFDRNGAYGFRHRFPFTGAPWHAYDGVLVAASRMYRLLLVDAVPFYRRLQLRLERGAYGDQPMCSEGLVLAYQEPEPALAPVARLDLSDPVSIAAAGYELPLGSECDWLKGAFIDEPPTALNARVCRFTGGTSGFRFVLKQPAQQLWLRRRFDGTAGGQAGLIEVNGEPVGHLPYAMAQSGRPWQQIDLPLDLPAQPAAAELQFRIAPVDPDEEFTESAYWLFATVGDPLYADGFELVPR